MDFIGHFISMDGRGRCMDNIFIERLWRSLKYEAVYLHGDRPVNALYRGDGLAGYAADAA